LFSHGSKWQKGAGFPAPFLIHCVSLNLLLVTIITLGRPLLYFFVTSFAGFVTEVFVNVDFGRLAFVTLGAVTEIVLVSFVVESNSTLLVLVGVAVGCDSNVGANESQKHHHDYQFFHCLPPDPKNFILGGIAFSRL
jgi:hypothetical protein